MDIPKGDKLVLRGLKFHGYHGVKQEERKLGQKFLVDVDAWMDLRAAGESDCLSDTLSYTDIYRIVKEVMEGPPKNLLESVAQLIASTTLTKYPQIFPLMTQKFSFEEQARLVWQYLCSVPLMILEDFIPWLTASLSSHEKVDFLNFVHIVVPEEKLIGEIEGVHLMA